MKNTQTGEERIIRPETSELKRFIRHSIDDWFDRLPDRAQKIQALAQQDSEMARKCQELNKLAKVTYELLNE